MIRPEYVAFAKKIIEASHSNLLVGTVIDFPEGKSSILNKLSEASQAIENGVDDLDFVCNYQAFKEGKIDLIKEEIILGTQLGLAHRKTVKWIIEVAALNDTEIIQLSALIKNIVVANFDEEMYSSVYVKSSTGFYKTQNNLPNGATPDAIILMLENASPLSVKAAGGVRTYAEAIKMIQLGVKRIGTSSAKAIAGDLTSESGY